MNIKSFQSFNESKKVSVSNNKKVSDKKIISVLKKWDKGFNKPSDLIDICNIFDIIITDIEIEDEFLNLKFANPLTKDQSKNLYDFFDGADSPQHWKSLLNMKEISVWY